MLAFSHSNVPGVCTRKRDKTPSLTVDFAVSVPSHHHWTGPRPPRRRLKSWWPTRLP